MCLCSVVTTNRECSSRTENPSTSVTALNIVRLRERSREVKVRAHFSENELHWSGYGSLCPLIKRAAIWINIGNIRTFTCKATNPDRGSIEFRESHRPIQIAPRQVHCDAGS